MSVDAVEASEWDGARFGREESTGVVMGLEWDQVVFLGVGVVICLPIVIVGGFPVGLVIALVIGLGFAGIGIPRFGGKSLIRWAWIFAFAKWREQQGQAEYVQPVEGADAGVDEAGELVVNPPDGYATVDGPVRRADDTGRDAKGRIKPGPGLRFGLPGEMNELRAFQLPGGAAFVYDPRRGEAVVVAQIMTEKAFDLEAFDRKEDRVRAWASVQSSIARLPGVARVQCSDQTTIISGAKVLEWYTGKQQDAPLVEDPVTGERMRQAGAGIDPFLDASFVDLMNQAEGQPVHAMWMSIVISRERVARRIQANGGRLRGFMDTALGIMAAVEGALPDSGTQVVEWHTPRSLAALIRSAFDPASTMEISDRGGERAGVSPGSAGPMHAKVEMDRLVSDGALHRTFKISEWPQAQARLGFLDKFVFAGDFRHTVSLFVRPRDTRQALRDVSRRKADWQTNENIRSKLGRPASQRHERQQEDIEREESELVNGYASLKVACLMTVSAFTEQELEANCDDLRTKAAEAGCEIRMMGGEQDSAFVAAATPLGRLVL